ncbi:MAG: hypothetical protein KAV87_67210, partial [Desulfobacteraceae bacterium]|nr:hypothetical protein [Desulfobacteraceae bacterium]
MRKFKWTTFFWVFLFLISSLQPCLGHWVPEDGWKMHYPQNPDPRGWDVCFRRMTVADDFECIESGAVTDIHFWISWKNDLVDEVLGWTISIYSDENSQPGRELWRFKRGKIELRKEQPSLQGWLCPCMKNETDQIIPENHTWYALVNVTKIEEPFIQKEGEVYWLVIRANATLYESPRPQPEVGWKTSIDKWGSPALWRPWPLSSSDAWRPVASPDATSIKPHNMAFVINGLNAQFPMDFGDVEETRCNDTNLVSRCNSYPTTLARNGARHIINPNIFLGSPYTDVIHIDAEPDGQPSHLADGDDNNGVDDEDGVLFKNLPLVPGTTVTVTVLASADGFLDAWIDFNADGDWDDFGEQIFACEPLAAGINYLKYHVPCYPYAIAADVRTYARFRFSTHGRLRYGGPARNGEVEDYLVKIEEQPQRTADLGDAPDSTNNFNVNMTAYTSVGPLPVIVKANYPTVYLTGSPPHGPIHWYPDAIAHLGGRVSLETEADFGYDEDPTNNIIPPRDLPDMDLADDAIKIPLNLPHCRRTRFDYIVTIIHPIDELYVNVWFDWSRDGDWDDVMDCGIANEISNKPRGLAREWAVHNQVLTHLPAGIHKITTPAF